MNLDQCAVDGCSDQPYIEHPLPLCRRDALMVSLNVTDVLHANALRGPHTTGINIETVSIAPNRAWTQPSHPPVVYFLGNGNRVKIGTSTNITARVSALSFRRADVLLLLQGGNDLEDAFHDHFAADRIGSTEWFVLSTRIRDYIKQRKDADAALRQPHLPAEEPTGAGETHAAPGRPGKSVTADKKIIKVLEDHVSPLSFGSSYVHRNDIARHAGIWASTLDNTLSRLVRAGEIHRKPKDGSQRDVRGYYGLGPAPDGE